MDEKDTAAIRRIAAQWEEAWNRHDMSAMAELLTADADFVNVGGNHWKGRTEIAQEHARRHQTQVFKESVWTTRSVQIEWRQSDVALVHVEWAIRGDRDRDGTPRQPRQGIFTGVMMQPQKTWRIRAAHKTHVAIMPTR
jgi:uncharacterized protein (TIGR02246 family)